MTGADGAVRAVDRGLTELRGSADRMEGLADEIQAVADSTEDAQVKARYESVVDSARAQVDETRRVAGEVEEQLQQALTVAKSGVVGRAAKLQRVVDIGRELEAQLKRLHPQQAVISRLDAEYAHARAKAGL